MPVIPVVNEGQAMNVNSPVAVGNADTSMHQAVNKLGSVLENLGTKLESAQQAQRAQITKNEVESAVADYWQAQNAYAQERAISDEGHTRTGLEAVDALRKNGESLQQKFIKDMGMDESMASAFLLKAKETDQHFTPSLMKESARIGNEQYQATKQQALLKKGVIVSSDLSTLPQALVDIEEANNMDSSIVNKVEAIRKDQAVLFESAIGSSLRQNKFGEAKTLLEQGIQRGVYLPDEAEKRFNSIRSAQHTVNSEWRASQSSRRQLEKEREVDQRDEAVLEYVGQAQLAVADPGRLDAIITKIQSDPRLPSELRLALPGKLKTVAKGSADRYEASFKNQLLAGDLEPEQARERLFTAMTRKDIPLARMGSLSRAAQQLQSLKEQNPGLYSSAKSYAKELGGSFQVSRYSGKVAFADPEQEKSKAAALTMFWDEVTRRQGEGNLGQGEIEQIFNEVKNRSGKGASSAFAIPPGAAQSDFKNLEAATKWMNSFQEKVKRDGPNVSKEEKLKRIRQKQAADEAIKVLMQREAVASTPPPPKKAPANGRSFDD